MPAAEKAEYALCWEDELGACAKLEEALYGSEAAGPVGACELSGATAVGSKAVEYPVDAKAVPKSLRPPELPPRLKLPNWRLRPPERLFEFCRSQPSNQG